jgi:hypothetical protein
MKLAGLFKQRLNLNDAHKYFNAKRFGNQKCNPLKLNKENSFQLTLANASAAESASTLAQSRRAKAVGTQSDPESGLSAWHQSLTLL